MRMMDVMSCGEAISKANSLWRYRGNSACVQPLL